MYIHTSFIEYLLITYIMLIYLYLFLINTIIMKNNYNNNNNMDFIPFNLTTLTFSNLNLLFKVIY